MSARAAAESLELKLRHAIEHAKAWGDRSVMLPMDLAAQMHKDAESLVAQLPDKPKAKR